MCPAPFVGQKVWLSNTTGFRRVYPAYHYINPMR
jgi:hypothetical protein